MKMIIGIVITLLILGGLGFAYYWFVVKPSQASDKSDGKPCNTEDGKEGTYHNGVCIAGRTIDTNNGNNNVPLSDEELNPANADKLIYAKINNPYIILSNGGTDTSKLKGDYLGLLVSVSGTGRPNDPQIYILNNGNKVYSDQEV